MALIRSRASKDAPVYDLSEVFGPAQSSGPAKASKQPKVRPPRERREPVPPTRGYPRPMHGQSPRTPALPVFRGSSGQMQGLYPWLFGSSVPPVGSGTC